MGLLKQVRSLSRSIGSLAVVVVGFLSAAQANTESSPAQTTSFFEKYATARGEVPYPFAALIQDLRANESRLQIYFDGSENVSVANGRSLVADKADCFKPRRLFALMPDDTKLPVVAYFGHASKSEEIEVLSWNPDRGGSYEFLRVLDYREGGKPRIEKANPKTCLACHQNSGPIFTHGPSWEEVIHAGDTSSAAFCKDQIDAKVTAVAKQIWSSEGLPAEAFEKVIRTRVATHDEATDRLHKALFETYAANPAAIRVRRRLDREMKRLFDPEDTRFYVFASQAPAAEVYPFRGRGDDFDRLVRDSSSAVQGARICREICGSDPFCRRKLILMSLLNPNEKSGDFSEFAQAFVHDLKTSLPTDHFAYPSSVIPDREMTKDGKGRTEIFAAKDEKTLFKFMPDLDPAVAPSKILNYFEEFAELGVETSFDGPMLTKTFAGVQGFADPARPRPRVGSILPVLEGPSGPLFISEVMRNCLSLDEELVSELRNASSLRRADLLHSVVSNEALSEIVEEQWPPQRDVLLKSLGSALQATSDLSARVPTWKSRSSESRKAKAAIDPKAAEETWLRDAKLDTLEPREQASVLAKRYCSECHDTFGAVAPDLPLEDLKALKLYRGKRGQSILERIQGGAMPPSNASFVMPEKAKARLIELLK